jgi:hypothetical protein
MRQLSGSVHFPNKRGVVSGCLSFSLGFDIGAAPLSPTFGLHTVDNQPQNAAATISARQQIAKAIPDFTKIKFTLSKTAARDDRDAMLQGKARRASSFTAPAGELGAIYEPTDAVLNQVRTLAPGWDRQALLARYREWSKGKPAPNNAHGAFLGWVKRFTKRKAAA